MDLFVTLLISMEVGLVVLFAILWVFVRNIGKPSAVPIFGMAIALYIVAALFIGRYLPDLLWPLA